MERLLRALGFGLQRISGDMGALLDRILEIGDVFLRYLESNPRTRNRYALVHVVITPFPSNITPPVPPTAPYSIPKSIPPLNLIRQINRDL
jgi:hypothetical protein